MGRERLRCVEHVVTRVMKDGGEVLTPSKHITPEAGLRAVTLDAAWRCGADRVAGAITPGKYADFVLLENDPTKAAPSAISKIKVSETWMEGVKRLF